MKGTLAITGDSDADRLLNTDPLALLIGMLLDQQVPMEWAFKGPALLKQRLGGRLDADEIAAMDPEELVAVFCRSRRCTASPRHGPTRPRPVRHDRRRTTTATPRRSGLTRRRATSCSRGSDALPGYGEEKSKIFVAILAKRMDVKPEGWEQVAGPFADPTPRSVADIDSPAALEKVREWKKMMKAKGKTKQD